MPTRVATFLRRLSRFAQRAVVLVHRVPITAAVFVTVLVAGLITEAQETNYWPILVQRFGWDLTALNTGASTQPGLVCSFLPSRWTSTEYSPCSF